MNLNKSYMNNNPIPPQPQIPMKNCIKCGAQIGKALTMCPYCGKKQKKSIGCLGVIGIVFGISFLLSTLVSCVHAITGNRQSVPDEPVTRANVTEPAATNATTAELTAAEVPDDNRPQKNGFSEESNATVQVGLYAFSVPSYWEADITESDNYRAYAETSGKSAMILINAGVDENDPVSYDALVADDENMKESFKGRFESCEDIKSEPFETETIKGYLYSMQFTKTGYHGYCECFVFPSEEDNKWFYVSMTQTDNTEYSYIDDFRKILNSISYYKPNPEENATGTSSPSDVSVADIQNAFKNGDYSLVTPEFKEYMDSYEAFIDQYVDFMKKYNDSDNQAGMFTDYMNLLQKELEWADKIGKIDESNLSPADDAYYLLVTARATQKLLGASVSLAF